MNYKKLFFLSISMLLFSVVNAQQSANAIDTYFQQYVEDEQFSVIYISPRLFQLIESFGSDNLDLDEGENDAFIDIANDLRGLRILSTDTMTKRYFDEFKTKLDTRVYEPLITIREKDGGKLEFYLKENNEGIIEEFLFLTYGEDNFTFMSFVGNIELKKIVRLAEELENE